MKKVADAAAVRAGKPGAFAFEEVTEGEATYQRMWEHLPGGKVGAFVLEPVPKHLPCVWPWNGSKTKPTIERPIRIREQRHRLIENGRMISDPATDVVAQPATLPLPPPRPIAAAVKTATRSRRQ